MTTPDRPTIKRPSARKIGLVAALAGLMLALTGCGVAGGGEVNGEANLHTPDLSSVSFFGGALTGRALLALGFIVCLAGLVFGLVTFLRLRNLPVHKSMREVSELIWETCK
ncbi:MAG: sodium-translocating pyrophosphatase, partial [Propionibacteriaceae bacterium]|nr:sodium-translocating pyrophosphatase [Propionibacteriaceae bacterium]